MCNFISLPEVIKGSLLLWLTLISFLLLIVFLHHYRTERSRLRLFVSAAEVWFAFTLDMILTRQIERMWDFLIGIPAVTVVVLISVLTVITFAELFSIIKLRDKKLSPLSVKESIEYLPTGTGSHIATVDSITDKFVSLKCKKLPSEQTNTKNVSNA